MTLNPGMTSQFTATVSGTTDTAVTWSISPSVGTISATGLYTAPGSVSSQQIITIRATSAADSTKSATAVVTVNPPPTTGLGLSVVSLGGTRVRVSFTAPAGRPANDWIGLSSPGAPYWWTIWNSQTNGKTSGYFDVTLPTTAGIYEFRYYSGGTFNIAVTGAPITSGTTGYAVTPTSSSFTSAQYVTYSYNAPKAVAGDCVALVPVGQPTEKMIWFVSTNGAKSGTGTGSRQAPPGTYELRYITQGGYVSVAISSPIQIR
jgi:hypothetical protein